ncbi:MAG: cell division protein ZapA [Gammaproteobacteria bacterium]|jgi:cell division protein ZapA|nr:cell division protein ZapA [Pseudomonadota bacterium]MDG2302881.1 cell division protein ZapA [Gammaproteobacteria bacterium]MBT5064689.1 cell division protein ZapA [Pseudomonadota bacterium]MBT6465076.1 cell division protein ZapA [Pseudomonadota bacterium]MBT7246336.1 cell division protein ZapA [Pseudomonadota bacterium]
MSDGITPVKVTILNNDYLIGCKEDEKEELMLSVDFLNNKIAEQNSKVNNSGNENTAVLVALNIANEHLKLKKKNIISSKALDQRVTQMQAKIDAVLSKK